MSYVFFRSMISSPRSVKFLELDNVGGLGQLADGKPLQWNLQRPPESDSSNGNPETRHPGPMRGHLRPIQSQFANLQRLHIRTVGQDLFEDSSWASQRDKNRYAELASFIDSVRLTLESLLFEQGLEPEFTGYATCGRANIGHGPQKGRPMDSRFLDEIMPVLLRAPWPKLKSVTILGVGGQVRPKVSRSNYEPDDPAVFDTAEDRLRVSTT
jgi:hypothetical protein